MYKRSQNLLLQRLPSRELSALSPSLKSVSLGRNSFLFEPNAENDFLYFPLDAVISFAGSTGQDRSMELWSVGYEGVAGVSSIFGAANPFRGVVVVPGTALRTRVSTFRHYFDHSGQLHDAALSYYRSLLVQISCLGFCNSGHSLVQRLSRWLLTMQERAATRELQFTQGTIARMLGTRRATISEAAAVLQSAGLISYTPGAITIKSRAGLKKMVCGCYAAISAHQRAENRR